MSEFEDTMDNEVVECPYCGHTYQPETEDYDEHERPDECDECGKFYYVNQSFSVTHHATPDCELNDGTHDYQPVDLRNGRSHPFCTVCGKCQPFRDLEQAS